MKRIAFLFFIVLGLLGTALPVWAQEPKVRASLPVATGTWVGQRVTLAVELLAPGYFAGAPSFDLPDPQGLLLLPPDESPVVGSETIGDVVYTVQRHELSVFARRSGEVTIPPLRIRFSFKRMPLDKDTVPASVQTPPLTLKVQTPPGAEKFGSLISARDLKVEETWRPEPGKAKAGDALVRTITFTAPDVPAMAFPRIPPGQIDGIKIYTKDPEILDHSERGELSGQRRDTLTYACQRPGQFTIPAARFTWWNLDTKKLETIELPARTLEVAPNPALASAAAQAAGPAKDWHKVLAGLAGAIGLAGLSYGAWRLRPFWAAVARYFAPIHLAPLNPGDPASSHGRAKH